MNFFDGVVIICNGKGEETERRALVKCKHCYAYEGDTCKVWMNDTAPDNWCSDGMVEMRDEYETD